MKNILSILIILMKKLQGKKIQMKKIKCIDLLLEETSNLTSIHPQNLYNSLFKKKYKS